MSSFSCSAMDTQIHSATSEQDSSTDYCFCLTDEDPSSLGHFFKLDCSHSFHRKCLRDLLRHHWLDTPGDKMIDPEGRKVTFFGCPLCRKLVSPSQVRELQFQQKIIRVRLTIPEQHISTHPHHQEKEENSIRTQYTVTITKMNYSLENSLVVHQIYHGTNLPVYHSVRSCTHAAPLPSSSNIVHKLLEEDYSVLAESSLTSYRVLIEQIKPEYKHLHHFKVIANNLVSLELDSIEEEDSHRRLQNYSLENRLKIMSAEDQQRTYERLVQQQQQQQHENNPLLRNLLSFESMDTHSNGSSSPPLPSLEEVFGNFQSASSSSTTTTTTTTAVTPVPISRPSVVAAAATPASLTTVLTPTRPRDAVNVPVSNEILILNNTQPSLTSSNTRPIIFGNVSSGTVIPVNSNNNNINNSPVQAGPSRIPDESPYWRSEQRNSPAVTIFRKKNLRKTPEEKIAMYKENLKRRQSKYKSKINASISATLKQFNYLKNNVTKWKDIRQELFYLNIQNSSEMSSSKRLRMQVQQKHITEELEKLNLKINSFKEFLNGL